MQCDFQSKTSSTLKLPNEFENQFPDKLDIKWINREKNIYPINCHDSYPYSKNKILYVLLSILNLVKS